MSLGLKARELDALTGGQHATPHASG